MDPKSVVKGTEISTNGSLFGIPGCHDKDSDSLLDGIVPGDESWVRHGN